MKSTIFFVAVFGMSVLASCSSSTSNNTPAAPSNGATINGTVWTPDVPTTAAYFSAGGITQVGEFDSKSQMLQLVLPGAPKTGTYTVGGSTSSAFTGQFVKGSTLTQYIITSGSVNVTAASSTHITGTFNFHATSVQSLTDSVVVTNGGFDANVITN
ncbi:MAG TPA: DUF6252 family protein [Candidatus Kapabacteria bacterium]|nr:DUF6252 family protein [Candidatus Kapabacteria bacterium]